jgi:catechol 2,3-dioxygenase-like lactoylglutathione lyase family enzyme
MNRMIDAQVTRLDHAVIAVRDLNAAIETYRGLGFNCVAGGRHQGRGTENAIIRFGLDYLELISVHDEKLGRSAGGNVLDLINYVDAHSGGGLGFAIASHDLDALAATWSPDLPAGLGPFAMERMLPDGRRLSWRLFVPGGTAWRRPWPFFIEWETPAEERLWVDGSTHHANGASSIAGVGVVLGDLPAALRLYVDELGLTIEEQSVQEPSLTALRTRLRLGEFYIDLLQPTGAGSLMDALQQEGDGLFQIDLNVPDLTLAMALSGAVSSGDDGAMVSPSTACGMRLMFRTRQNSSG